MCRDAHVTQGKRSKTAIHVTKLWDCQDKWPCFSWKQTFTTRAQWRDGVWYIAIVIINISKPIIDYFIISVTIEKKKFEIISLLLTTITRLLFFFYHMFLSKPESAVFTDFRHTFQSLSVFSSLWRHFTNYSSCMFSAANVFDISSSDTGRRSNVYWVYLCSE